MKRTVLITGLMAFGRIALAAPLPAGLMVVEPRGILPTTPGLALTNSLAHGFGFGINDVKHVRDLNLADVDIDEGKHDKRGLLARDRMTAEPRGILPTTPGLALTNSLAHGFGSGSRDVKEIPDLNPAKAGTDDFRHDQPGGLPLAAGLMATEPRGILPTTPGLALTDSLIHGFGFGSRDVESFLKSEAKFDIDERKHEKRGGLPHGPNREYCYYERPNNIFVKMPCNSGRVGMHCDLLSGQCHEVTRLGFGHGIPVPSSPPKGAPSS